MRNCSRASTGSCGPASDSLPADQLAGGPPGPPKSEQRLAASAKRWFSLSTSSLRRSVSCALCGTARKQGDHRRRGRQPLAPLGHAVADSNFCDRPTHSFCEPRRLPPAATSGHARASTSKRAPAVLRISSPQWRRCGSPLTVYHTRTRLPPFSRYCSARAPAAPGSNLEI